MKRFNEWLAIKLTNSVGSMACAYLFLLWSLIPLLFPQMTTVVSYVSQSIIQLVLLSVIMVGQDIGNRAHEKRDNESHDAVMDELTELREMHRELRLLLKGRHSK